MSSTYDMIAELRGVVAEVGGGALVIALSQASHAQSIPSVLS
jgi:hypothetical protein